MAAKSNGSSVTLRLKEQAEECRGSGNEEERGSGGKHGGKIKGHGVAWYIL